MAKKNHHEINGCRSRNTASVKHVVLRSRIMKKDKSRSAGSIIIAVLILMLTLTACGKSEFGVSENTGKQMTVIAQNADKDAFFMVGALDVADGEQIVITSTLTKGSVRVEIVEATNNQSIKELPIMDTEAIITANLENGDSVSGTVAAGSYLLRATCLEKATGTIQIEVKPAAWSSYLGKQYTGQDPWGNPLSVTLKGIEGNEVSFAYESVIGEGEYTRTFLAESSGELKDGAIPFHITATAKEYEAMHLDYSCHLTLKDGSLFVTYDAGSVMEESTEGGSAGYQALALEGEDKTVELRASHSDSEDSGLTPADNATTQAEDPSGAVIAATEAPASTHRVEVADQSVTTFKDNNGGEYKTIIPMLIVDGKEADSINAALRDYINKNHPLTQNEDGVNGEETKYAWGVRGDIVSIIIIASETFTDGVGYEIFNYNADTLQAAGNDEVIKAFGMTADEYCGKVAEAYRAFWNGRPYLQENMSDLDRSIGAISLANVTPFITPDGNLGAAGHIYMTGSQFPEIVKCFDLDTLEIEHFAEE